ncbi:MAG: hypothetical protein L0H35_04645 [Psychrobacter sp.]|nr:hypothetical protein [Psychrobacter sp.]
MIEWLYDSLAIAIVLIVLYYFFGTKVGRSRLWKATVTPLASIIGSGFLVSGPLLLKTTGAWATLVMTAITIIAYGVGASIRFNIQHIEPQLKDDDAKFYLIRKLESLSKPALGIAYLISVTFYLKLLSAFALKGFQIVNTTIENVLTTGVLLFIGTFGFFKGLVILEHVETYSVNIKLAIIFALTSCFFLYNLELVATHQWHLPAESNDTLWSGFRKILGMLIIVQGFETSRYLGEAYRAKVRVKTMRHAQWLSAIVYVVFVAVSSVLFVHIGKVSETTVIDLSREVTHMLPYLLIIAAILSQFSAAISDTLGGGGLLTEALNYKITSNTCYVLISACAIGLTWSANIYEIITIASQAFALYYALQLLVSMYGVMIKRAETKHWILLEILFTSLFILMLMVLTLSLPFE